MRKLGQRIELSQDDEIKMMQRWLRCAASRCPDRTRMHMHGAHADAGHADAGRDGAARGGEGRGVRSPVPRRDDQAPWRRADDGARSVCHAGRRPGVGDLLRSRPTSTPISAWKSIGWARCSTRLPRSVRNEIRARMGVLCARAGVVALAMHGPRAGAAAPARRTIRASA